MNVFVLSTGRCGSLAFSEACRHIRNFTSGHETRCNLLGDARFAYPDNHIECDNRLSWLLGRLEKAYGDRAIYVHLSRNDEDTARSYFRRYSRGIMKAYRGSGILAGLSERSDPMAVALDYCGTVNSNIELFLKDKSRKMEIHLESMEHDFPRFWDFIGAEGELSAALGEFHHRHNATRERTGFDRWRYDFFMSYGKLKRLAFGLPRYIKDA